MIVLSVDPGLDGALAGLDSGSICLLEDMPTMMAGKGKGTSKRKVNAAGLADLLRPYQGRECLVMIEEVSAMPRAMVGGQSVVKMGAATAFGFGRTVGCIEGVCLALGLSIEFVTPAKWKGYYGLPRDKEVARARAIELYPQAPLHLKKHHGRAEALLLCRYGWERIRPRGIAIDEVPF